MTREEIKKYYSFGNPLKNNNPKQMDYYFLKAPSKLFRYRSDSDKSLESLINNKIWMATPKELNDPFECRFEFDLKKIEEEMYMECSELRGKDEKNIIDRKIAEKLRIFEGTLNSYKKLRNNLYMACFSERNDSILMWSHYANFHKGFCIEYSRESLIIKYKRTINPIIYDDNRVNIWDINDDSWHKVILTKAFDWEYEKEYRFIIKKDVYEKGIVLDSPLPTKIWLGNDITCENQKIIERHCIDNNIKLSKMILHNDEFRLIEEKLII
jgi:hypothetical protein